MSEPNMADLNQILRERLGPDVWAKGVLAAISQDAPDDYIRQELAAASPDEIKALARVVKEQTDLVEIFTNVKPAQIKK
jgi:hypothetical protein